MLDVTGLLQCNENANLLRDLSKGASYLYGMSIAL